jgi:predicted nucleotidyltransferase
VRAQEQLAVLSDLRAAVVAALEPDDRVARIWLAGSLGRNEGDELSDLDVTVVAQPGRTAELKADLPELIGRVGPVAFVHWAPQNAPSGGTQLNVLYDTEPLPVYIDWTLWPPVERRPADVAVLLERYPPLPRATADYASMANEMPRERDNPPTHRTLPAASHAAVNSYRLFMIPILAKHAARGRFDNVEEMLRFMDVESPRIETTNDAIELGRRILGQCGAHENPSALACLNRYLNVIADRQGDPAALVEPVVKSPRTWTQS